MREIDGEVTARLVEVDQRYTKVRRRIVEVLARTDGPLTITGILERAGELAQSSVYRNLAVLEAVGVVSRIVTHDDFARYELAEHLTEHHHHLICSNCGDVSDFSLADGLEADLDAALRRVASETSFIAEGHRLDLLGICAACS